MGCSYTLLKTQHAFVGILLLSILMYFPMIRHTFLLNPHAPSTTTIASSQPIVKSTQKILLKPEKNVSFCFVVSIYGQWASNADRLQRVDKLPWFLPIQNSSNVTSSSSKSPQFFVFTNMPNLPSKGWTKIVQRFNYTRYITQSRYAKFFAWKDPRIIRAGCQVVFYQDAIGHIRPTSQHKFQEVANEVYYSKVGLAQYPHSGGGGAFGEFRRIEVFGKDIPENIQASKSWLLSQSDFKPPSEYNCTLYENRYIGYAVRNDTTLAQAATNCFWPHYSQEIDSWRDQPLWCYCLDKWTLTLQNLNNLPMSPIILPHKELWQLRTHRMGKAGHRYGPTIDLKKVKS